MEEQTQPQPQPTKARGFNSMTPERRRELASAGGKAVALKGTGHHWTPEAARAASLKSHENRKAKKLANGGV